jgi:hypothetical protein
MEIKKRWEKGEFLTRKNFERMLKHLKTANSVEILESIMILLKKI